MTNFLYLGFLAGIALYWLLAPKKETPVIIGLYVLLQYAITLSFWRFSLSERFSILMWFLLVGSFGMLVLFSNKLIIPDSPGLNLILTTVQWAAIFSCFAIIVGQSPYEPLSTDPINDSMSGLTLRTGIKLCGNLIVFICFSLLVLKGERRWGFRESLRDFGPIILYTFLVVFLAYYQLDITQTGVT